jgi:hypothetical protein
VFSSFIGGLRGGRFLRAASLAAFRALLLRLMQICGRVSLLCAGGQPAVAAVQGARLRVVSFLIFLFLPFPPGPRLVASSCAAQPQVLAAQASARLASWLARVGNAGWRVKPFAVSVLPINL